VLVKSDKLLAATNKPEALTAATCQADPFHTLKLFAVVLKYKSPVVKGSPSLSTEGSLALAPKYVSSKLSAAASAASLALFAALAALLAVFAKLLELLAKLLEFEA